jgi:hypothetical protein
MALSVFVPDKAPNTGLYTTKVRPITEGQKMNLIPNNDVDNSSGWGFLDSIGASVGGALNTFAQSALNRELARSMPGPEVSQTTSGEPNNSPQDIKNKAVAGEPFYITYKKELMYAGGALLGLSALYFVIRS